MTRPDILIRKKPVIYLYQMLDGAYLYDANVDTFIPISMDTYNALQKSISESEHGVIRIEQSDEINQLIQKGFLSEKGVDELYHPMTDVMEVFSQRSLPSITLQLTQDCNLRCKYCIYSEEINHNQRSHSKRKMSLETAFKAVDFLYNHSADAHRVNIGYYGGEPLLEFAMIKQITEYAENRFSGKSIGFSITTNATLLTGEKYAFMKDHGFSITISMDGDRISHNRNRIFPSGIGSFETVVHNIDNLKGKYPDISKELSVSSVVDPQNTDIFSSDSLFGDDSIVESLNINIAFVESDDPSLSTFSDDFLNKYQLYSFLELCRVYGKLPENYRIPILFKKELERRWYEYSTLGGYVNLPKVGAPSGPCMPGLFRLFIDTNGDFYPCERVSELSDVMHIGSLDSGFNYTKMRNLLNVSLLSDGKCKTCPAFRHCGICAKLCDGGDTLSVVNHNRACKSSLASFKEQLKFWTLFYKESRLPNLQD